MREVVETGKQAEDKGDYDVDQDEEKIFDGTRALAPGIQQFKEGEGHDAEEAARTSSRCDSCRGEVTAQDEAKDAAAEIDESEADGADAALHISTQSQLQEQVEADVDYSGVQEDGSDEAPPLIGSGGFVNVAVYVGIGNTTHAAELTEGAGYTGAGGGGGIGTGPDDVGGGVLDIGHVVHAGLVSRAHVDKHVWRRADHGIKRRMDLNRRTGKHTCEGGEEVSGSGSS